MGNEIVTWSRFFPEVMEPPDCNTVTIVTLLCCLVKQGFRKRGNLHWNLTAPSWAQPNLTLGSALGSTQ